MVQERRKAATQRCYHVPSSVPLQSHGTQLTHPMSKLLQATIGQMNLLVIAKTIRLRQVFLWVELVGSSLVDDLSGWLY